MAHEKESPLDRAVRAAVNGGCIVYPTETFYALGAKIGNAEALERIIGIKGRPGSKPLPVIIGNMAQLAQVADENARAWPGLKCARELMECFWPGPLSIVLPVRKALPPQLSDAQGLVSVRLTPHPAAREICLRAKTPLVATSANVSGKAPVSDVRFLSPTIRAGVDAVFEGEPRPAGGLASTVVKPVADQEVVVCRAGALPVETLARQGFRLIETP